MLISAFIPKEQHGCFGFCLVHSVPLMFNLTGLAGYRLVGDCDFDECKEVASLITPVSDACFATLKSVCWLHLRCELFLWPASRICWNQLQNSETINECKMFSHADIILCAHLGARRRGPDDDRDAPAQHGERLPALCRPGCGCSFFG